MLNKGKLIAEYYFWAWMTLHPEYLVKLLVRLVVIGLLVLGPLLALNWQLADRGIQPQMPSRSIQFGNH